MQKRLLRSMKNLCSQFIREESFTVLKMEDGVSHAARGMCLTGQKHPVLWIVASLRGIRSLFQLQVVGALRINNCLE